MPSTSFVLPVTDKSGNDPRTITGRRLATSPDCHLTFHAGSQRVGVRITQDQLVQLVHDLKGLIDV